jgi:maltose O-acetyltransferase
MNIIYRSAISIKSKVVYLRHYKRIQGWIRNGLQLGENVTIMPTARIDDEYSYLVKIGNNCSLSHGTNILAHDATPFKFTDGCTKMQMVELSDNVFVGSDVIILPGCSIGPNVTIAAGSVVNKDIPPNSCIAGVPARRYQSFDEFLQSIEKQILDSGIIQYSDLNGPNYHEGRKWVIKMIEKKGIAYVKGFSGKFPYTFNGSDFNQALIK